VEHTATRSTKAAAARADLTRRAAA
jgi:hypothetical protein